MLVAERNNFLAAVCPRGKIFGLALVDLTTGDFLTTELEDDAGAARRNWNGCARRKSFIPARRRRCAICSATRSRF